QPGLVVAPVREPWQTARVEVDPPARNRPREGRAAVGLRPGERSVVALRRRAEAEDDDPQNGCRRDGRGPRPRPPPAERGRGAAPRLDGGPHPRRRLHLGPGAAEERDDTLLVFQPLLELATSHAT